MNRTRRLTRVLAAAGILGLVIMLGNPAYSQAQVPGTQPIPVTIGWDQETLNGLNAINNFRAQQNPPLPPLQVDAVLQYAAAWEANDQMTNGQCFGQSGNPNGPEYYPYAPATMSALATCPHTDSLGRSPGQRLAAFGYTSSASENANFGGGDNAPVRITQGQVAYQGWYDMPDPDASGNPTYAHRLNLIGTQWRVVGLAKQCDVFGHRCFWVFNPGVCLMQAFVPPSGPNPPLPPNRAPACAGTGAVTLPPATLQPPTAPTFTGTWTVDNLHAPTPTVNAILNLTQTGNQVTGTYSYTQPCGPHTGTLTGTVSADRLTISIDETGCNPAFSGGDSGMSVRLSGDGQRIIGGSFWNGTRTGSTPAAAAPTPAPTAAAPTPGPSPTAAAPTTAPAATAVATPTATAGGGQCAATPITVGQTINGTLSPADCPAHDGPDRFSDRYSFNGTAGQSVVIGVNSTDFDSSIYLLGAGGAVLAENDDSGGSTNSRIPETGDGFALPAAGTYTIEVTSFSPGAVGAYTLTFAAGGQ